MAIIVADFHCVGCYPPTLNILLVTHTNLFITGFVREILVSGREGTQPLRSLLKGKVKSLFVRDHDVVLFLRQRETVSRTNIKVDSKAVSLRLLGHISQWGACFTSRRDSVENSRTRD